MKLLLMTAGGLALLASTAFAQQPSPAPDTQPAYMDQGAQASPAAADDDDYDNLDPDGPRADRNMRARDERPDARKGWRPAPPPRDQAEAFDDDAPPPPPRDMGPREDGPRGKRPPGPRGWRDGGPPPPPPPSKAAHFRLNSAGVRLDVKCAENEPMKVCADIALQMIDRAAGLKRPDRMAPDAMAPANPTVAPMPGADPAPKPAPVTPPAAGATPAPEVQPAPAN